MKNTVQLIGHVGQDPEVKTQKEEKISKPVNRYK
jgi:single-stranded DNA-binding protein